MGVTRLVLAFSAAMIIFAIVKAVILLQVAACDDSQLSDDDSCFKVPDFNKPDAPRAADFDLSWSPQYVSSNSSSGCTGWNLLNPICHLSVGASKTVVATLNTVAVLNEGFRLLFEFIQLWVAAFIVFPFKFMIYMFQMQGFLFSLFFTFVPGAPWYVNIPFIVPLVLAATMVAIKVIILFLPGMNE